MVEKPYLRLHRLQTEPQNWFVVEKKKNECSQMS
jgi:hypothetical protein